MKLLEKLRREQRYSQRALGAAAKVPVPYINRAEADVTLYPAQLERIAEVLGYQGNPNDLLDDVTPLERIAAVLGYNGNPADLLEDLR